MRTTSSQHDSSSSLAANAVKGAAAGALAVWAMDRLDWFMFTHEDPEARRRTERVRPDGLDPAHVAAQRAAHMVGTELHPAQPNPAGIAMHYSLGVGPGAIYGMVREKLPVTRPGQDHLYGLGFGLTLFLMQDEGLNQIMGLSGKQKDYPWQAHGRGLLAHLTYGLVLNTVLNILGAPRPAPAKGFQVDEYAARDDSQEPMAMAVRAGRESQGASLH